MKKIFQCVWLTFIALAAFASAQAATSVPVSDERSSQQYEQDFDYFWEEFDKNYAYFDQKQTDWNKVKAIYKPLAANVSSKIEFIALLEKVLDELYDSHTHLKVNTKRSPRLVPSGLDVWAEWQDGTALITDLRSGFSVEQAGLKAGMKIISMNGMAIKDAVAKKIGASLKSVDPDVMNWALRAALAGTRDVQRVIVAQSNNDAPITYELDMPAHNTVDRYQPSAMVEARSFDNGVGYLKINDLGADETVAAFDKALEKFKSSRGLILDLRATQSGGDTSVAEPIMGRFIEKRMPYQKGIPTSGKSWTKHVSPHGSWQFRAPLVVLVSHWTASMGEGMAIGFDAMQRATIVGTKMARLNGAVFDLKLPRTGIRVNYAGEKLFHIDGTPRENFVPPQLVDLVKAASESETSDAILAAGLNLLNAQIEKQLSNKSATSR